MTEIVLPKSVKIIDTYAFARSGSLERVVLPEGVLEIHDYAFLGCLSLNTVNMPETVTYVGEGILMETAWEKSQPEGLLYLGDWCIDVTERHGYNIPLRLTVKEGITKVGNFQFPCYDTYGEWLTIPSAQIYIPASVEYVGCIPGYNNVGIGDQGGTIYGYTLYIYGHTGSVAEKYVNKSNNAFLKFENVEIFKDVAYKAWYYQAVKYAKDKGVMLGVDEDNFEPNAKITREQLIVILYRANGENEFIDKTYGFYDSIPTFDDVPEGDTWYNIPIKWAKRMRYTYGIGDNKFGFGQSVTREQMATMILRIKMGGYESISLTDAEKRRFERYEDSSQVSSWAVPYVAYMIANNYMEGVSATKAIFAPKSLVTRAEIAQLIYKVRL